MYLNGNAMAEITTIETVIPVESGFSEWAKNVTW